MLHLHLLGLLSFEILALIAAFFLLIYVNTQQLGKWYRHFSKAIVIILHVIILATIIHPIVHHFHASHSEGFNHNGFFQKHHGHDGHFDHEKGQGEQEHHEK